MNEDKKKNDLVVSILSFIFAVGIIGWFGVFTVAPFVILKFLFSIW